MKTFLTILFQIAFSVLVAVYIVGLHFRIEKLEKNQKIHSQNIEFLTDQEQVLIEDYLKRKELQPK